MFLPNFCQPPSARKMRPMKRNPSAEQPSDQPDGLHVVLDLIRAGVSVTRPELVRQSGLGRKLVTQRVDQLIASGLVADADLGPSTGGRAPRQLRFRADAGVLLVAEVGFTSLNVGISDLTGRLLEQQEEAFKIGKGLDHTLDRIEELFDRMLAGRTPTSPPVWGIGVGVLGPVNAATGRPAPLPNMPGWVDYPVRDRLAVRYDVPVWVDNEVNLMALGEFRGGLGRGERDIVFIKIGSGIGAGLISGGRLHRGASGAAGEVGHITVVDDESVRCWCGNTGCLVQLASGEALSRLGTAAADSCRSPYLAALRSAGEEIDARAVAAAAATGDAASLELLTRAGHLIGTALATVVNSFNPTLILVGGGVAAAGDLLLAAIRETVYRRSLPLSTRDLRIAFSPLSDTAGLIGAAFMVLDHLFSRDYLGCWIDHGSPAGRR
jgi:glucokinase-like ROK family protein